MTPEEKRAAKRTAERAELGALAERLKAERDAKRVGWQRAKASRARNRAVIWFGLAVFVVTAFWAFGSVAATIPPKTPTAIPAIATIAPYVAPSTPGVYHLWYKGKPTERVIVTGPSHQSGFVDVNQLYNWLLDGTACINNAGTKAYRGSSNAPFATVAIEVGEGTCRGFVGWVPMEAFQMSPP